MLAKHAPTRTIQQKGCLFQYITIHDMYNSIIKNNYKPTSTLLLSHKYNPRFNKACLATKPEKIRFTVLASWIKSNGRNPKMYNVTWYRVATFLKMQ